MVLNCSRTYVSTRSDPIGILQNNGSTIEKAIRQNRYSLVMIRETSWSQWTVYVVTRLEKKCHKVEHRLRFGLNIGAFLPDVLEYEHRRKVETFVNYNNIKHSVSNKHSIRVEKLENFLEGQYVNDMVKFNKATIKVEDIGMIVVKSGGTKPGGWYFISHHADIPEISHLYKSLKRNVARYAQ